jgi:hypothetical protein
MCAKHFALNFKPGGRYNSHLHLRLPQGLFPSYFQTKILINL